MEKVIRDRYNEDILREARNRYGIDEHAIKALDGFESFIYEYEQYDSEFILRIGHSIRRSVELIHGEVDWINYLYANGVGVAMAVPSVHGQLVEAIADGHGGQFLAAAFVKAQGGLSWENERWNEDLFVRYGRTLGRMHTLSKDYQPADPSWRRLEWDDPQNVYMLDWVPDDQVIVSARVQAIMEHLQSLPKDRESYGLIHQDAHAGNFFVDDHGNITLFDFDDAVYSWFVYDIAMVIFYAVTNHDDPQAEAARFWPLFWHGYCLENKLDPKWLAEIPIFLKYREVDLYAVIHRSIDLDNNDDPWVARFMAGRQESIEQDIPYLDYNFPIHD